MGIPHTPTTSCDKYCLGGGGVAGEFKGGHMLCCPTPTTPLSVPMLFVKNRSTPGKFPGKITRSPCQLLFYTVLSLLLQFLLEEYNSSDISPISLIHVTALGFYLPERPLQLYSQGGDVIQPLTALPSVSPTCDLNTECFIY